MQPETKQGIRPERLLRWDTTSSATAPTEVHGLKFDQVGTALAPLNPQLDPLSNAGGITLVHTFPGSSPLFDAGDDALISLGTDQRGAGRLIYNHVDIGAVEFNLDPARYVTTLGAIPTYDPYSGGTKIALTGTALPGSKPGAVYFEIGPTTAYGSRSTVSMVPANAVPVAMNETIAAADGYTIHYRGVLSNAVEVLYGADQVVTTPFRGLPGDINRDGVLSESEMQSVLANYFQTDLWLTMTNTAGLGSTNVSFALTTNLLPAFNVSVSTNLTDWEFLGPAQPRYDFVDTNAVDNVMRYYRLEVP